MMQKLIQNFLHPPKEQGLKIMMQKLIQNQGLKRPWLLSLGHYLGTWQYEIFNICVNSFFLISRGIYFHLLHFLFYTFATIISLELLGAPMLP